MDYLTLILVLILFILATFVLMKLKHRQPYIKGGKVEKIIIYPIKSLSGFELKEAILTNKGLKYGYFRDR